jgi:hypothetical protein
MFRVLSVVDPSRVYPQRKRRKPPAAVAAVLALALTAAGCGGGGGGGATETSAARGQVVSGTGFAFRAPADWKAAVGATSSSARLAESVVSVTVLPLVKPYRIALFPAVAKELDRVASTYAATLKGKVTSRRTVEVGGRQAREYVIEHGDLVDRITFVLRGKRSYQLTCRWRSADGEPAACAQLAASFAFR